VQFTGLNPAPLIKAAAVTMRQSLRAADVDSASDRVCLSALLSSLKPGNESCHAVVEVLLDHANRGPDYGAHPTHDLHISQAVMFPVFLVHA
jgi:hypothetical protein